MYSDENIFSFFSKIIDRELYHLNKSVEVQLMGMDHCFRVVSVQTVKGLLPLCTVFEPASVSWLKILWSKTPQTAQGVSWRSSLANLALPSLKEIIIHSTKQPEMSYQWKLKPKSLLTSSFEFMLIYADLWQTCGWMNLPVTFDSPFNSRHLSSTLRQNTRSLNSWTYRLMLPLDGWVDGCRNLLRLWWQLLSPPGLKVQVSVIYSFHRCNNIPLKPFKFERNDSVLKKQRGLIINQGDSLINVNVYFWFHICLCVPGFLVLIQWSKPPLHLFFNGILDLLEIWNNK